MTGLRDSGSGLRTTLCASCNRPLGATTHVTHGYLSVYVECEWCFEGRPRPAEPELITDTFTRTPYSFNYGRAAPQRLDAIIDKLTGERRP